MVQAQYGWTDAEASCAHDYTLPAVLELIQNQSAVLNRPLRVLDLGCGNGAGSASIAAAGHEVTAVDVSADGIEIARRTWPSVRFVVASVYDDELADVISQQDFDCVISLDVVEHLFFPSKLIKRAYSLLAADGLLVISTPYHGYWKNLALSITGGWDRHFSVHQDGGHIKFFSRDSLTDMVRQAGFRDVSVEGKGRLAWLWKTMILVAKK
jgi:2-polyprenyl-3-methyl-5-hydroxy-6-metoxy-1,4-benzoquinol methylase